jgi:hypothetical protein
VITYPLGHELKAGRDGLLSGHAPEGEQVGYLAAYTGDG